MASKERRAQDKARQTAAYYRAGEAVSDELAEAYLRAYRSLQAEAERVFRTFSGVFGLSEAQARGLLKEYPNASARELLRRAAEAMTDGPEKTRALAEISAPAYQYRINRLETLQAHVERRLKEVARQELKLAKAHYTRVIGDSYLYGVYEVQRAAGVGFHFHDLSDRAVSAMVNARWPQLGITYSEAVWKDTAAIARRIREDVLAGAMTGLPARRSVERIEEDFRVRAYEARRLVRTETARMAAEADKASMEACGIEEYEFCATLDEAACSRCGALDGKRFPAEQGEPGVNMEPLHPNCGCYTVPVVEEFGGRAGTRLARDPETGENIKIPGDMTFEAWKAGLQDVGDSGRIYIEQKRIPQISSSSISEKIARGEYSTRLSRQQYEKHRPGTAAFAAYEKSRAERGGNPQSIITITSEEVQKIIETKAGTGIVKVNSAGIPEPREDITCDCVVGQYYGGGRYHNTHKASIRYGKKNAHLIPIRGDNFD
jgi:SPP1 gp7 family putative phage head morphogenesis protein